VTRVAVIGARCRHQGIGEFVARWFSEAGATVCAIIGTRRETNATTVATLEERYGIRCNAYTDTAACLTAEEPDIVAICSPFEYHREHLEVVAAHGSHCLCEKPFWWEEAEDRRQETARLVDAFIARDRYVGVLTQWPLTLPSFYDLHPQVKSEPVERFEFRLSPSRRGELMIPDAAPHVLSMVYALVGTGELREPTATFEDVEGTDLRLQFLYEPTAHTDELGVERPQDVVQVTCRFQTQERPPRAAWYAINGHKVDRTIDMARYDMYFESHERRVRIEDPLKLLVQDFLAKVNRGAVVDREALVQGIGDLELLSSTVASIVE